MMFYIKVSNSDFSKKIENGLSIESWVASNLMNYQPLYVKESKLVVKKCEKFTYVRFYVSEWSDIDKSKISQMHRIIDYELTELLRDFSHNFQGVYYRGEQLNVKFWIELNPLSSAKKELEELQRENQALKNQIKELKKPNFILHKVKRYIVSFLEEDDENGNPLNYGDVMAFHERAEQMNLKEVMDWSGYTTSAEDGPSEHDFDNCHTGTYIATMKQILELQKDFGYNILFEEKVA